HRIGQNSTVNIYWPQLGEIDEVIDAVINSKSKNIDILLKGKNVSFTAASIVQLQQQLFQYYQDEYAI
ncbi:MAG: hypothetical protein AB4372_10795, partial [Xenococcus sp. (in: cyanobacteria)]